MWPRDALLVVGLLGSVTPAPGGRWPRHQERCGAPLLVAAFVNDTSHLESGELSRLAAVVRCCRLAPPTIRHQQGATLGGADPSTSTAAAAVWRHCDPRRPANLTDASPPTIVVRALAEAASLQPWGGVSVRPGAGLRLDCVFPRDRGRPGWTWTSSPRQYLTADHCCRLGGDGVGALLEVPAGAAPQRALRHGPLHLLHAARTHQQRRRRRHRRAAVPARDVPGRQLRGR
ncbi:uncharacterized protein LOC124795298 isoform X2 [Schistocerca piceifrons]|uniref:uncharacterized protein LOC124795298 isoform X2 n=1 Tax=Schistocerca piceifrons TaxID=274613 RepID=UPI001F5FBD57|nr:uncharacterized protein LOC124795298 isoform X2 [Schistocerca piceifrons]